MVRGAVALAALLASGCDAPASADAAPPVAAAASHTAASSTAADPAFKVDSITLYLPSDVIETRTTADELSRHHIAIRDRAAEIFAKAPRGPGISGVLLVMAKPGGRDRVWIVTGGQDLPPDLTATLKRELEAVPPMEVHGGPVLVGAQFSAWGGGPPPQPQPNPIPADWYPLLGPAGGYLDDAFLAKVWPD